MKTTCNVFAFICATLGVIRLMLASNDPNLFLGAVTLFGLAAFLAIASVIIDRLDQLIVASYSQPNPKRSMALDLSHIFLIEKVKDKYEPIIIENSGTVLETERNTFSVKTVKFKQQDGFVVKECHYNCIMHYNGGDIYDANNWSCENFEIYS